MKYTSLSEKVVRISASLNRKIPGKEQLPSYILTSDFDGPLVYYVLFRESDTDYLLKPLLKKKFTHCLCLNRHEFGWILINPIRPFLHIDLLDFHTMEDVPYMLSQQYPDSTILEVIIKPDIEQTLFCKPTSCVSMVNYCLGLKWKPFTCMTPYQLYKNLLHVEHPNIMSVKEVN